MKRFFGLMSVCAFLLSTAAAQAPKKPLTIEAIAAEGGIVGQSPENLKWSPDNAGFAFILRNDAGDGELWYVDASTGDKKVLVSDAKLTELAPSVEKIKSEREKERVTRYHVAAYEWSPDSKHLLFDALGQLWLYSLESGTAVQVTAAPAPAGDPKFSPDGSRVAYLQNHNLYARPIKGGEARPLSEVKGETEKDSDKKDDLLNGEVDWVYAEELDVRSNYFWSPDGNEIAYLQMDESKVPSYPITNYAPVHAKADMEKYPQPGDPNPAVRIGVVSSSGGKTKWIKLTNDEDIYIPRFGWVRDGLLWAEVLNRAQDELDLFFVDSHSGHCRKVLTESDPGGWVYVNDDLHLLKSADRFTWQSWRDGTTQLYLYSFDKNNPLDSDAKLERQLTKGDFEVLGVERPHSGIEAIDEAAGVLYFSCNKDDPRQRQLYSVKLDGSGMQRVSQEDGMHEILFADDGKHYVDQFSALTTPPQMSLCTPTGCKTIWEAQTASEYDMVPPKFLDFKAEDGTKLYGELWMPEHAAEAKIPLVVYIYGGPAGQTVLNSWPHLQELFHQILAKQGFAVFTVDNRGTPARDRKFQTAVRHQYGAIELKDQLTALEQLFTQYPQLDRSRVAIWGWSNGGSMTLYAMTHSDAFKAGVSVAPVTEWHLYDSIYTERNNGLPNEKSSTSYTDMNLPAVADKLHGALLLVHGTSDDNVHFQNSVQMVDALIKARKQFRFMVYPGKTHGISGSDDRTHLFHMIDEHFERELK